MISGGSLKVKILKEMINASYNNDQGYENIGDFVKDDQLSNKEVLCYHNTATNQTVAVFRGTEATVTDWSNNAKYSVGLYNTTDRLNRARESYNKIISKYGEKNVTLVGHSQSAIITRKLGANAKEVINLNGANLGEKNLDNEYNIRSSTDIVSQVKPVSDVYNKIETNKFNAIKSVANLVLPKKQKFKMEKDTTKQNINIPNGSANVVKEHMPDALDRMNPEQLVGRGIQRIPSKDGIRGRGLDYSELFVNNGTIIRTPLSDSLMETLNTSSLGLLKRRLTTTSYDKLYHLRIDFQTNEGIISIEKNYSSIDITKDNTKDLTNESERMQLGPIPKGLTISKILENTRRAMGSSYSTYNGITNNCQDFILALLLANNLGSNNARNFVKQDLLELVQPEINAIIRKGVEKGSEEIMKSPEFQQFKENMSSHIDNMNNNQGILQIPRGQGIGDNEVLQSVIFTRPKWTKTKAINWLKKHHYKHIVDVTPEHYRFRQEDPKSLEHKGYHYITKHIGKDISMIIGILNHRNKSVETKDNKDLLHKISHIELMHKRNKYDSDSDSESDNDDEIRGMGLRREEEIIRKLNKLSDDVHEHHRVHGGKIKIAKAFKNLGSTIKKGFNKDIKEAKKDTEAVGKYVTSKNGLADDLVNYVLPATIGTVGGIAGDVLGGPLGGVAGASMGTYAGDQLAGQIDKSAHMDTRGDKMKAMGSGFHIDINSHNARRDIKGMGMLDNYTLQDRQKLDKMDQEANLIKAHSERLKKVIEKAEVARRKREMKEHHKNELKMAKERAKHGRGLLKNISKKITIKPKVGVDTRGNFSVSPDVGYKVNDNMEVNKNGFTYQLGGRGLTDEPLEAQNQAHQEANEEIKKARGRPKGSGVKKIGQVMDDEFISKDAIRPMSEPKLLTGRKPVGILDTKKPRGMGFTKGSQEAKDHMARIRALRKK